MKTLRLLIVAAALAIVGESAGSVPLPFGFYKPASAAGSSDPTLTVTNDMLAWWESTTIPVVTDGTSLTNWTDLSSSVRDLTQLTVTPDLRPLYKTSIFGSKPAVRFDGANDNMNFTHTDLTNFTVFVAWQLKSGAAWSFGPLKWRNGTSGGGFTLAGGNSGSTSNPFKHLTVWNTGGTEIANKEGPDESLNLPTTPRAKAIDTWRWDGTTCTMRKNGSAQTVSNGITGFGVVGADNIGTPYNTIGADVAAVLVYNVSLSDADVLTVETYLGTKYSIP